LNESTDEVVQVNPWFGLIAVRTTFYRTKVTLTGTTGVKK